MSEPQKPEKTPFEKMEELAKRVLSVSKEEVDRLEREREKRPSDYTAPKPKQ